MAKPHQWHTTWYQNIVMSWHPLGCLIVPRCRRLETARAAWRGGTLPSPAQGANKECIFPPCRSGRTDEQRGGENAPFASSASQQCALPPVAAQKGTFPPAASAREVPSGGEGEKRTVHPLDRLADEIRFSCCCCGSPQWQRGAGEEGRNGMLCWLSQPAKGAFSMWVSSWVLWHVGCVCVCWGQSLPLETAPMTLAIPHHSLGMPLSTWEQVWGNAVFKCNAPGTWITAIAASNIGQGGIRRGSLSHHCLELQQCVWIWGHCWRLMG